MTYRRAIRAVLLTPEGRMLLMHAQEPLSGVRVWFAPGGGMEGDETPEECLRREIREETGLVLDGIGPQIWWRRHAFSWNGEWLDQHEEFHLVRVEEFAPDTRTNPSAVELMSFLQFRWWTADEIAASDETFVPLTLAEHLRALLTDGPPAEPVDVGV